MNTGSSKLSRNKLRKSDTLSLTEHDRALLAGDRGPASKLAMRIIARTAEVSGADSLMDISAAHIDSAIYTGDATLEFAEHLSGLGAQVAVPSSLNVSGLDEHGWQEWAVPPEWAEKARRQMRAYQSMGCVPLWTCAPYQTEMKPRFGQQVAWGESNAIAFANSVIGARTERYPDLMDICAAITGRVPAVGLHLTKNRKATLLMRLRHIPRKVQEDESFFAVLGLLMGTVAGNQILAVEGIEVRPTEDQLKAMCAAVSSSGSVALFHLLGITPEAPTHEDAFQGDEPERIVAATMDDMRAAYRQLTTAVGEKLDTVVLGSPHFSLAEFQLLTPLLRGKHRHPNVQFLVTTSRGMKLLAEQTGALQSLIDFGGKITVDTCVLTTPMLHPSIRVLMTNSAKYSYYAPGLLNAQVVFGSMADCVQSAVTGRVARNDGIWR
jgi:hypothetical protein